MAQLALEVEVMLKFKSMETVSLNITRILSLSVSLLICSALNPALAGVFEGNQLFVSPSGNDSVTRLTNNINNPWKTVSKAMLTAEAGDVVNFRAGTYLISSDIITNGSVSTASEGTADNRIVYTNYQNENVLFNAAGGVIHIDRRYWTISGIDGISDSKVFWIGKDTNGDNLIIEKGTFTLTQEGGSSNRAPLVFQTAGSDNAIVRNCRFLGPGKFKNPNTAGIFIFRSKNIKILNNEFSGFPSALFYKHPGVDEQTGIEFAYNYFYDNGIGIRTVTMYANIHNNLFVRSSLQVGQGGGFGDAGPTNQGGDFNTIANNTFYGVSATLLGLKDTEGYGATNNLLMDNVFTSRLRLIPFKVTPHLTTLDYNLYPVNTAVNNNKIDYDLSSWQAFYGQDANSISGTAKFIGGASPSSVFDYALASDSPGYKAASNGADMGANMALISDGKTPKPPVIIP